VRARFTQYAVPGWGVGELWTDDWLLLTHEFRFDALPPDGAGTPATGRETSVRPELRERPPTGVRSSLAGMVPAFGPRVGHDFVPISERRADARRAKAGLADELADRFAAFLDGGDVGFDDVPIDLEWATEFQRGVAAAIRSLPRGEVASYGELAALAGYPGAARAVGTFCAHNRFMFVLPCHRVVGAAGIGGYGPAGAHTKRRLLALEGVAL
jgi:methylated-DNA-[protein]-cysteine S-methyltransferase